MLLRHAIGATLRTARTEQGRTLRDVAGAAAVSLGYLSEVERGVKEASSEVLEAACAALGLSLPHVLVSAARAMARSSAPVHPLHAPPARAGVPAAA